MQKEDLIKRIRLFATIITVAFVVLVVTLLVQFGFIAHYHTQMNDLEKRNAKMQQEIENLQKDIDYYNYKNKAEENNNNN